MKITLYMATSIDGYIAKTDRDSDWVSEVDAKEFEEQITEKGCIAVGNKTFYQYLNELYPVKNITNIVLSKSKKEDDSLPENVFFADSPQKALEIAKEKKHQEILLIGGGEVNGSFLEKGLINEIIISLHPIILGKGIKLFESFEKHIDLKRLNFSKMDDGLMKITYQVA